MVESSIELLIVEDDELFARFLIRLLGKHRDKRFSSTWTSTLEEGLKSLKHDQFDVILLDLGLPDTDGLLTISRMRQHANDTPIVVLTGQFDESMAILGSSRLPPELETAAFRVVQEGLTMEIHSESIGLSGMRERVTLLGGTLVVQSTVGKGTSISANFPFGAHPDRETAEASNA